MNPCRRVKWKQGQIKGGRERTAAPAEIEALLRAAEGDRELTAAVLLALNCGLRRMGVLGLTVKDPDFEARALCYTAKGGKRKVVPMNRTAERVLRELVEHAYLSGRLFGDITGRSLSSDYGAFKKACRRAGVTGLNFHDLRRTFSGRVDKMFGPTTVRDLLGHTNVHVTNAHYLPENFEAMRRAVDALNGAEVLEFRGRKTG